MVIQSMIEKNSFSFDVEDKNRLEIIKDYGDELGNPQIFIDGIFTASVDIDGLSSEGKIPFFDVRDDRIEIAYPEGWVWGACWIHIRQKDWGTRPFRDYSRFKKIRLEIKGNKGGEEVDISLKDDTDPDDGSESNVTIKLEDEWQTIEIPLEGNFETAELTRLNLVATFGFSGPQKRTVYIKKIQYLE